MELTFNFSKIYKDAQGVLRTPRSFFKELNKRKEWKDALSFLIVLLAINSLFIFFYILVVNPLLVEAFPQLILPILEEGENAIAIVPYALYSYVITVLLNFVWAIVLKYFLKLFSVDSSFTQVFNLLVYAKVPNYLLGWIPLVSNFAYLFSFYLIAMGLEETYSIKKSKSFLIVFSAFLLLTGFNFALILLASQS